MHTVLILGGSGFFGGRIGEALAPDPTLRVLIAGRNSGKLLAAAQLMRLPAEHVVTVDANDARLARVLRDLQVNTLIHTAGPFQNQNYSVARSAIDAGCHYIDLADGRQFVCEIDALDTAAKAQGVSIISGASSVPALSSAVIDRYLPRFQSLDTVRIGISSGARSPGLATMRGVFGYCGKSFEVWENGRWNEQHGWLNLRRYEFPEPVKQRLLGRCDVPDLQLFPRRYPSVQSVTFEAGFASDWGHLFVWMLAGLVKIGVLRSLVPFATPLNRISQWIEPLVSDKGGMFVILSGTGRNGRPASVRWHLLASQNHGPYIPCGAAIALARKIASGASVPIGAMPCVGLLSVEDYLAPLAALDIRQVAA